MIFINILGITMVLSEENLRNVIEEELSKSDVSSMISSKLDSQLNSREFKKAVKALAADVVSEVFKILWQRESFWKTTVKN
jgi:hypothetical protein